MVRIVCTYDEENLHNFDLKSYDSFSIKVTELSHPKPKLLIKRNDDNNLII